MKPFRVLNSAFPTQVAGGLCALAVGTRSFRKSSAVEAKNRFCFCGRRLRQPRRKGKARRIIILRSSHERLCSPDFSGRNGHAAHGVSRVHDALRPISKVVVVHAAVICCDKHKVKVFNPGAIPFHGFLAGPM
jgi:hypothetical protein